MMKKTYFDYKLYFEGIKQLKIIGIITASLMAIFSIIIPVGRYLDRISYGDFGDIYFRGTEYESMLSINPFLVFIPVLFAPFFFLAVFGFMNKRRTSDFYHSIPNTRTSIYLSFTAAAMTWIMLCLLGSTIITMLLCGIFQKYILLNMTSALIMTFNIAAGTIFVCGAITVAMCLTGTRLSNIMLSGLIIFMPRLLTLLFANTVTSNIHIIPANSLFPLVDNKYNVITNLVFGTFDYSYYNNEGPFEFLPGGIYTLVIGLLYFVFALYLFNKRKSENAENPASSRTVQAIIRIMLSFTVCLIPCSIITNAAFNNESLYGSNQFSMIILYIIAVIVYFAYEAISQKGFSTIQRTIPALGILFLLNIGFITGVTITRNAVLNDIPEPQSINSVVWLFSDDNSDYYYNQKSYTQLLISQVSYKNDRLNEIISQSLRETVEIVKDNKYWEKLGIYNDRIQSEGYFSETFKINRGFGSITRTILIKNSLKEEFYSILESDNDYSEAYKKLPEYNNNLYIYFDDSDILPLDEAKKEIYNSLREELPSLSIYNCIATLKGANTMPQENKINFTINGTLGAKSFSQYIAVSELTPKTYELIIKLQNKWETQAAIIKLNELKNNSQYNGYFHVNNGIMTYKNNINNYDEFHKTLMSWLENSKNGDYNIDEPFCKLFIQSEINDNYNSSTIFVPKKLISPYLQVEYLIQNSYNQIP